MYSTIINSTFSSNDDGKMELEVLYKDSDGKDLGAYATSDDISTLLNDIVDQLEEQITEAEHEEEPETEVDRLNRKIDELTKQIAELSDRNAYLEKALTPLKDVAPSESAEPAKPTSESTNKAYAELLDKLNKFNAIWGDDFAPLFKHVIA